MVVIENIKNIKTVNIKDDQVAKILKEHEP